MSGADQTSEAPPERVGSRAVYDGTIVHLNVDTVRFPDGTTGDLEIVRHSGASAVLPILGTVGEPDPEVLLIHQYRYATGGYLYEVPAGRPDFEGEDWEVCARRELEEETGLVAGRLTHLTTIWTTPGFTDERIHIFLAEDLTEGKISRDVDEFIELVRLPLSAAMRMVETGEISDAKTLCALLHAAAFRLRA
jgi:ADP-ribose pyrophosphatase